MLLTQASFARLRNVSKVAITKAVQDGRVVITGGKVDTDNPVNAVYDPKGTFSKAVAVVTQKPSPQVKRKAKAAPVVEDIPTGLDLPTAEQEALKQSIADLMTETADLDISKKKADIALKIAMERRHSFRLAQDKRLVVPREDVRRAFAMMSASIESNVLKSPAHAVPMLFAMAKAGASIQEGILELERILGQSVARVVDEVASAV